MVLSYWICSSGCNEPLKEASSESVAAAIQILIAGKILEIIKRVCYPNILQ